MTTTKRMLMLVCVLGLGVLVACSAQKVQKEVDEAAQKVVEARVANQVDPSPANEAKYLATMETYTLAVAKYEKAKASDDVSWEAAAALGGVVGGLLGFPLGGLVDPFRRLVTGQRQGATMATTALTNADTANTLQTPTARASVSSALASAPEAVSKAVEAHI